MIQVCFHFIIYAKYQKIYLQLIQVGIIQNNQEMQQASNYSLWQQSVNEFRDCLETYKQTQANSFIKLIKFSQGVQNINIRLCGQTIIGNQYLSFIKILNTENFKNIDQNFNSISELFDFIIDSQVHISNDLENPSFLITHETGQELIIPAKQYNSSKTQILEFKLEKSDSSTGNCQSFFYENQQINQQLNEKNIEQQKQDENIRQIPAINQPEKDKVKQLSMDIQGMKRQLEILQEQMKQIRQQKEQTNNTINAKTDSIHEQYTLKKLIQNITNKGKLNQLPLKSLPLSLAILFCITIFVCFVQLNSSENKLQEFMNACSGQFKDIKTQINMNKEIIQHIKDKINKRVVIEQQQDKNKQIVSQPSIALIQQDIKEQNELMKTKVQSQQDHAKKIQSNSVLLPFILFCLGFGFFSYQIMRNMQIFGNKKFLLGNIIDPKSENIQKYEIKHNRIKLVAQSKESNKLLTGNVSIWTKKINTFIIENTKYGAIMIGAMDRKYKNLKDQDAFKKMIFYSGYGEIWRKGQKNQKQLRKIKSGDRVQMVIQDNKISWKIGDVKYMYSSQGINENWVPVIWIGSKGDTIYWE